MPLVTLEDAAGQPIQFMEVDGIFYPYNSAIKQDQTIPATRAIAGRDDDVLLITYAKSGKTNCFNPCGSQVLDMPKHDTF